MKLKIFLIANFIILNFSLYGQPKIISTLGIGDDVGNITLGKIINYSKANARVSDFKGKLVILDFWNIYCASCIAAFPKLAELQRKFGEKIVIMPVGFAGYSSKDEIEGFYEKREKAKKPIQVPSAIVKIGKPGNKDFDSELWDYWRKTFAITGFPSQAWIDEKGKLIGLTNIDAVNADNIKAILEGNKPAFKQKRRLTTIGGRGSYFIREGVKKGSVIVKYTDSLANLDAFDESTDSAIHFLDVNRDVFHYYRLAYCKQMEIYPAVPDEKRLLIDSGSYFPYRTQASIRNLGYGKLEELKLANLFGYELVLPGTSTKAEAYQMMIEDLDRYFNVKSKIERRVVTCLALVRTSTDDKFQNRMIKGFDVNNLYLIDKIPVTSAAYLVQILNQEHHQIVLDETQFTQQTQVVIEKEDAKDLNKLRSVLNRFGLDLLEVEREIQFVVLKSTRHS